jgi:hypothetical protein
MTVRPFAAALVCLALVAPAARAEWKVGRALVQQRAAHVSLRWSELPLRQALASLARSQHVAMLLDRRVDPDRPIDLTIDDSPLDDVLERIAAERMLAVAWLGPLAYLGPDDAARRLRTLAALRTAEARKLPAARRAVFGRERAWQWAEATAPRELFAELAEEAEVALDGLDRVPHDLWPAADLPPLSWTDRLTLIANEFDLAFELADDGRRVRLTEIDGPVAITRSYPGGREAARLAERYQRLAPAAQVEVVGGKVTVTGFVEDHERLANLGQGGSNPTTSGKTPPKPPRHGKEVYSLTVEGQPVAAVLEALGEQAGFELRVDRPALKQAGLTLDRRVTFSVSEVSLDELLRAALEPAGLAFRREGKTVHVVPRPER